MKPITLAIIFLITIIAGSLATTYYIRHEAEQLHVKLIELEKLIDQEKWEQSSSNYKEFKKKWHQVDHKWSMLIDHYEIDYINMDLGELEAFIKTKSKSDALAKISSLQLLIKHIPEKEYPTLKNIL